MIEEDAAMLLHDHVTVIDCCNQEMGVPKKNDNSAKKDGKKGGKDLKAPSQKDLLARKHYNMTDILDLQSSLYEECCSITCAAAYFYDCRVFLETTLQVNPAPESEASQTIGNTELAKLVSPAAKAGRTKASVKAYSSQMLQKKRPTQKSGKTISVTNCDLEQGLMPAQSLAEKQDSPLAISNVFADRLSTTKFPLDLFPYHHSMHAIETYLAALGLFYRDVLLTFHSEANTLAGI
ncbi:hypothetical protein ACHAO9_012409 [Fusarium lateritium]